MSVSYNFVRMAYLPESQVLDDRGHLLRLAVLQAENGTLPTIAGVSLGTGPRTWPTGGPCHTCQPTCRQVQGGTDLPAQGGGRDQVTVTVSS